MPLQFGIGLDDIATARSHGLHLGFGTFWLGAWTQRTGWAHAEQQLRLAASLNITPVINWWYWGDDISPACVEHGCYDARQQVWKDKTTWYRMSTELAALIRRTMGGRLTVVILETEFNKGGIESYEPFDGYLADHAAIFRQAGNTPVVIGFGNWGHAHWTRFDRAAQAGDALGVQLLRSSIREAATYAGSVDELMSGARYLQATFRKAVVVTDLALSSYPSVAYEAVQAQVTSELFARRGELRAAGVVGVFYRTLRDDPTVDLSNYHGEAERHWGLLRADGSPKPAFSVFVTGVREENGGLAPPCTTPGTPVVSSSVVGTVVTLQWTTGAGGTPSSFVIEAGSAPGLANLAVAEVSQPILQAAAPPGIYYLRVRARNACGISGPSSEMAIRVGP